MKFSWLLAMGLPEDFSRPDTALAFLTAFGLHVLIHKNVTSALVFAVSFVVTFLILKHILIG